MYRCSRDHPVTELYLVVVYIATGAIVYIRVIAANLVLL